ncbi:MAG: tRNA uracil 4-sulfurtransferase ThiI [Bacilli bacterium]|jgi:thiamine biosynthesis protein ThiI|nr:tRNA 4-thiouridine(8) synthase ThiI [Acholeplasmataceae bacterium]
MYDLILVRYGEMTLKKKNYQNFLKQININIKNKLEKFPNLTFKNTNFRFYIYLNGEDYRNVIKELDTVVGLSSYSLCLEVKPDYDEIARAGIALINYEKEQINLSFKVETNRSDKNFPATSIEISQAVAKRILPKVPGLTVDVHHPDMTLSVDLRPEGTFVFVKTEPGLGGLPSGMSGRGLLMLSGGIDSPVAGYLCLRKGIELTALHFASPPYTSDMALQKVIDILAELSKYTLKGEIALLVCPFTKIQTAIHQKSDPAYTVTLMRRQMYKIADMLARNENYSALVNGESVGQVASQTLESLAVINEVTNLPVLRPLATYDKAEIMKIARKINTYEISIRPYEDCCTVFLPEHPIIKPRLQKVLAQEAKCELDGLLSEALEGMERISVSYKNKISLFEKKDNFQI